MGKFLPMRKLSYLEIILIPEALFSLFISRLKVSYIPSSRWMPKNNCNNIDFVKSERIAKAVLIAKVINGLENRTPWKNTCLVKAIATRNMLQKRSLKNTIHIGVKPKRDNQFGAHAWLSVGTKNILGGENLTGFYEISGFQ